MTGTAEDPADQEGTAPSSVALRAFFALALVFTAVGLIETGFIAYDVATHGSLSGHRAPDLSFGIRSWTVHHALRPGFRNPVVQTNSFGLRSPEVAIPKPDGAVRILLLGDSFTFGMGVADNQVFARRLESGLRQRLGSPSIEVVNAGVLSYCPLLEYLQYRHHLHALQPDLVILNFDMSDVQDHLAYSRDAVASPNGVPLFVTEPSLRNATFSAMPRLLFFEWIARRIQGARGRVESTLEGVPFVRDQDRYLWALDNGPPMDREAQAAMAPIADLQTLLRHDRIPLALATYPQPWQVSPDATPLPPVRGQYGIGYHAVHLNDRPFHKLAAYAREHQIPFVDATGAFRADADPAALFLGNDFHFTPRGHDLYASVLLQFIVDRSLLGTKSPASQ